MSSEKRTRSVEFMCLLLYYGGILHPYTTARATILAKLKFTNVVYMPSLIVGL